MNVDELIKSEKQSDVFALDGAALLDLKKVLAANAREPNRRRRVSIAAFLEYLRNTHKICVGRSTFAEWLRTGLGRKWDQ